MLEEVLVVRRKEISKRAELALIREIAASHYTALYLII